MSKLWRAKPEGAELSVSIDIKPRMSNEPSAIFGPALILGAHRPHSGFALLKHCIHASVNSSLLSLSFVHCLHIQSTSHQLRCPMSLDPRCCTLGYGRRKGRTPQTPAC